MLEKLAEMVREDVLKAVDGCGEFLPCFACDRRPKLSEDCEKLFGCPEPQNPDGSLMLARWAVLLVARALSYEADGITPKIYTVGTLGDALVNLIAEAKEGE